MTVLLDGSCIAWVRGGHVTGESQELSGVNAFSDYVKFKMSGGTSPWGFGLLLSRGPILLWDSGVLNAFCG